MREDRTRTPDVDDPPEPPRRAVLGGLVGLSWLSLRPAGLPAGVERPSESPDSPESDGDPAATADPHTEATFRAVADAMVPRTPDLADEMGDETQEAGGLAVDLEEFLLFAFNSYFPTTPATEEHNARGASSVAALLDEAATELLAEGENEEPVDPTRFPGGGPFAGLSRRDRFRAIDRLERREFSRDSPTGEDDAADLLTDYPGAVHFAMMGLNSFTVVGYYTEWAGYGDTKTAEPTEREFTGEVQSWKQTGYPGPARGYADLRGYEVRRFKEGEY